MIRFWPLRTRKPASDASRHARALSELATRAKLLAAATDRERVLIRAREMRRDAGLPESEALGG